MKTNNNYFLRFFYSTFNAWFSMEPYKNVLLLLQAEEP